MPLVATAGLQPALPGSEVTLIFTTDEKLEKCRGTSDRVWRSAVELHRACWSIVHDRTTRPSSASGRTRTCNLPINSRSNPCLRHRQKGGCNQKPSEGRRAQH